MSLYASFARWHGYETMYIVQVNIVALHVYISHIICSFFFSAVII